MATVTWAACVLLRVELFSVYGRGTGRNRAGVAPLDLAGQAALQSVRVRGSSESMRRFQQVLASLAVPGEMFRHAGQVWEREGGAVWAAYEGRPAPGSGTRAAPPKSTVAALWEVAPKLVMDPTEAHQTAVRWAKDLERDARVKELLDPLKNDWGALLALAATACVVSAFLAPLFPREASVTAVTSVVAVWLLLLRAQPSARPETAAYALLGAGALVTVW